MSLPLFSISLASICTTLRHPISLFCRKRSRVPPAIAELHKFLYFIQSLTATPVHSSDNWRSKSAASWHRYLHRKMTNPFFIPSRYYETSTLKVFGKLSWGATLCRILALTHPKKPLHWAICHAPDEDCINIFLGIAAVQLFVLLSPFRLVQKTLWLTICALPLIPAIGFSILIVGSMQGSIVGDGKIPPPPGTGKYTGSRHTTWGRYYRGKKNPPSKVVTNPVSQNTSSRG